MNIGIIGMGIQGRIRLNAIREISPEFDNNLNVVSVCDVEKPSDLDLEGISFEKNYQSIVENKDIDTVFVCTPNFMTRNVTVAALANGKHVFSEKPPGRSLGEMEEIANAERLAPDKKLMFGFNHRHHDSIIHAKEVIDSGDLGKVLWMRGRYGKSVRDDFCNTWRAKRDLAGGGIFLDQGIHMLDLFLLMAGDFDEVKAFVSNVYWKLEVEDNVFAIFRNKAGQVASLHSTMTQWRHLFSFEIFLEYGHIVINGLLTTSGSYGQEQISIARNSGKGPAVSWSGEENRVYNVNTSWSNEVRMFFNCVLNDLTVPTGNSSDALKIMKLVDKVYKESA